jgi:pyruvate/2-oxoacid:ferredoxin oxidoreductase alpha subunit
MGGLVRWMRFFLGYSITPATGILEALPRLLPARVPLIPWISKQLKFLNKIRPGP